MFAIGDKEWAGLSKLAEECGELVQVIGKLMGTRGHIDHWDGTDLLVRLVEEMGDVRAALIFACEANDISKAKVHQRADTKLAMFWAWHNAEDPPPNALAQLMDVDRHQRTLDEAVELLEGGTIRGTSRLEP